MNSCFACNPNYNFLNFLKNKRATKKQTKKNKSQNQVKKKTKNPNNTTKNPQTGPTFFNDEEANDNKHLARDACLKDGFLCEEGIYMLAVCPRLRTLFEIQKVTSSLICISASIENRTQGMLDWWNWGFFVHLLSYFFSPFFQNGTILSFLNDLIHWTNLLHCFIEIFLYLWSFLNYHAKLVLLILKALNLMPRETKPSLYNINERSFKSYL